MGFNRSLLHNAFKLPFTLMKSYAKSSTVVRLESLWFSTCIPLALKKKIRNFFISLYPGKAFSFPFYRNTTEDGRWIQVPCYQVPFVPAEVTPPPPPKNIITASGFKKSIQLTGWGCCKDLPLS